MENGELKVLLKKAKLSKKELSEIFDISYQAVKNWGTTQAIPYWLKAFLENYIKAKKYDELMKMMSEKNSEL